MQAKATSIAANWLSKRKGKDRKVIEGIDKREKAMSELLANTQVID